MSEEKRFTKKRLIIEVSVLTVVCVLAGVLGIGFILVSNNYANLSGNYDDLYVDYLELQYDFNELDEQYYILTGEYTELENDYIDLLDDYNTLQYNYDVLLLAYENLLNEYNALQIAYDYICNTIKQTILPVQYSIFAEAVRRYYMDLYLEDLWELDEKEYWMAFAEFCRDIILHDSYQHNAFIEVSNAFSNALVFGNDTMYLSWYIMYSTFWDWLPNWDSWGLTGNELTDIDTIVDWCIDEIDYEYDSDITYGQYYFDWDYIKFPVETAFRTMGDCEDQAILAAAYLESCGFETAIAISHDPAHPTIGAFYHGHLLVHIEDTIAYNSLYPSTNLWTIGGIDPYEGWTWAWLDTTWNVPFGSNPSWLVDYGGSIGFDIMTVALCDIEGDVSTNIGNNLDLTCVMST